MKRKPGPLSVLFCGLLSLELAACGSGPANDGPEGAEPEIGSIEESLSFGNHGFAWVTRNTNGSWVAQNNFFFSSGVPSTPMVSRTGVGRFTVTFHGLGAAYTGAGRGGNVQVVATNQAGTGGIYNNTRCKVTGWTVPPTQTVTVACHDTAGALADSPFIVHYIQQRSNIEGTSGYVLTTGDPTSGVAYNPDPTYSGNTAGGLNSVQRTGLGAYAVTFGSLAAPLSSSCATFPPCYGGNPQVTAYDPAGLETASYCKLTGWAPSGADEVVNVQCYGGAGTPADARFSINFDHRPSSPFAIGAHAFANDALSASYLPDPAHSYNSSATGAGTGTNLALRQSKGVYQLRHFGLENNKAAPHVTAYGPDNLHCKIEKWSAIPGVGTDVQVETRCWSPTGGAPKDSRYAEVFISRRAAQQVDGDGDGYTISAGDCADANPSAYPGAPEVCSNVDDDCDGLVDEGVCLPSAVATGGSHTCVLLDGARIKCWGRSQEGQAGLGSGELRGDSPGEMGKSLPIVNLGFGRTATAVAAGFYHTCALLDAGQVKCWGGNGSGELGVGDTASRGNQPDEMGDDSSAVNLGTGRVATAVAAGGFVSCARLDNGQLKCWGRNFGGSLGQGDLVNRGHTAASMGDNLPAVSLGTGRTALRVAVGLGFNFSNHVCALLDNGQVKCWGQNASGELGLGDTNHRGDNAGEMGDALPAVSLGTGRTATAIAAGNGHTCALLDNAQVKCWGANLNGELGLGDTLVRGDQASEMGDSLPVVSLGTGRTTTAISAGAYHTCALLDNAQVKCWGYGWLGFGDLLTRGDNPGEMGDNLPALDLGPGAVALEISSTASHRCAVLGNVTLKCWGTNGSGELGLGDIVYRGDHPNEMGSNLPAVSF